MRLTVARRMTRMVFAWLLFLLPMAVVVAAFQRVGPILPRPHSSHNIENQVHHRTIRNMFTGIVEEMGTVVSLVERDDMPLWDGSTGKGTELTVKGKVVMDGAYLG
jgi:hypothetical protein